MSEMILDSLEDLDQLWTIYWSLGSLVWVLVWLGIRRWLWWGLKVLVLGLTAGLIFTMGTTENGSLAPATMLAALAFLSDPANVPVAYVKMIILVTTGVTSLLTIIHLLLSATKKKGKSKRKGKKRGAKKTKSKKSSPKKRSVAAKKRPKAVAEESESSPEQRSSA